MDIKDKIAAFILGIDFTPNYEYWWNKPDLTKEELIWVMAGISPADMSRYQELQNNNDNSPWYWGFHDYFRTKHRLWNYGSDKHQECDERLRMADFYGVR